MAGRFVLGVAAAAAGIGLAACGGMAGAFGDRSELVAEAQPCGERRFEVYFDDSQARLTPAAREAIGMAATQLQGCDIRRVRVIGLADARGGSDANLSLSQRRALAVAEAFAAAGWPAPAFEVEAAGDQGATTEAGAREPLRRRTEVLVEAAPRA